MLFKIIIAFILFSGISAFSRFSFLFNEQESCIPPQIAKHEENLVFFQKLGEYVWKEPVCNQSFISTYYVSQYMKLTWLDAFIFCKAFDMQLATFDTKQEEDFVLDMIASNWLNNMESQSFIGGTKIGRDNWYWISTGEIIDYKIRWRNGEPNNLESNENCLSIGHYHSSFAVIDIDCHKSTRSFICERFEKKTKP